MYFINNFCLFAVIVCGDIHLFKYKINKQCVVYCQWCSSIRYRVLKKMLKGCLSFINVAWATDNTIN